MRPLLTAHPLEPTLRADADACYRSVSFEPIDPARTRTFRMRDAAGLAALGRLVHHPDGAIELGGIWTAPRWRGHGLARRMVQALLHQAGAARRIHCIALEHLVGFYGGFGFAVEPAGTLPPSIAAKAARCHGLADDGVLHRPVPLVRPQRRGGAR